ncbi:MAG TPA: MauE/DoxX family redox-associated membrane protein [Bryobacteraceae bacterium]|nr:MauE/DoxX family redox-associated membrane protein [Bryobacteraceae bacterium]
MNNMDDSIAQAPVHASTLELPTWKTVLSVGSAILLAVAFLVAGGWKLLDPFDAAQRMSQAKVPGGLALYAAVGFGIAETFAAVLLLIPRFRRWGALLIGAMLIAFMIYIGYHYEALRGEECSCFPWLKRAVGPGFFITDGALLLLAVFAWMWAPPVRSLKTAMLVLAAVAVAGLSSFGIARAGQTGVVAPASITVEGQPYSLALGRKLLYFFDPECSHCYQAAKAMSEYQWKDVQVIAVPVVNARFGPQFLKDTGLKAVLTSDADLLRKTFPFGDAPFAVAVENGRQKASFIQFDGNEPKEALKKLAWVD